MSIRKELQLLLRDLGGLVVLFVMPLVLIITITLIQDATFRSVGEIKILLVDDDLGEISKLIQENLHANGTFDITTTYRGKRLDSLTAEELVRKGRYQVAIILPENLSNSLQGKIDQNIAKIMSDLGFSDNETTAENAFFETKEIALYFDPAVQLSFKSAIKNGIDRMVSAIETQSIYRSFYKEFDLSESSLVEQKPLITYREIFPKTKNDTMPNSVQHNVPAWTLFAIFFIVVPLSINFIKEKQQGTHIRLLTLPVSYSIYISGKITTYLIVCYLQFLMMLCIGYFLFPYLDLPQLHLNNNFLLMSVVAICAGLAAIGFGVLIGTFFNTHEQSAPFGATSVVILAAIGGVWIPVFAMPDFMQYVSHFSPMNWGLSAFYDILLRKGNFFDIYTKIIYLLLFFIITTAIAIFYDKKKRNI